MPGQAPIVPPTPPKQVTPAMLASVSAAKDAAQARMEVTRAIKDVSDNDYHKASAYFEALREALTKLQDLNLIESDQGAV